MPVWGWVTLFMIVAAIMIPIKLKVLKKIINKNNSRYEDEE
ncbi:hypothetical protein [Clostridium aceticum]|nr:hypothetical protein [Clostridium aceticum]